MLRELKPTGALPRGHERLLDDVAPFVANSQTAEASREYQFRGAADDVLPSALRAPLWENSGSIQRFSE
jgi:hypothetical protein